MDNVYYPIDEKLRGVNLGGWLVLEKWMTPSLFGGTDATDEYMFMQMSGAKEKLDSHRRTFITEKDFEWIAASGLNAVRIPVGYWIFGDDGPFEKGIDYLDFAVEMAEKYGLRVLIDLHAVKGSQNGQDHGGRVGQALWFQNYEYRKESVDVLVRLAERYKDSPSIWGIELLNEPKIGIVKYFILKSFYKNAYHQLAKAARPGIRIVFSDGFIPWLFSGVLRPMYDYPPVMDIHWYQFGFTDVAAYFAGLERRPQEIARLQRRQPVIVGEWSGMLSHHTLAGMSDEERAGLEAEHLRRQVDAYDSATGWFYWTYKTEGQGIWNFRWLVEKGKIHLG